MASKKKKDKVTKFCKVICVDFTRKDRENAVQCTFISDEKGNLAPETLDCIDEVVLEIKQIFKGEVA